MNILDTLAPKRGPKQRRYGVIFAAKSTFYGTVAVFCIFVAVAYVLFNQPTVLEPIPATRVESEVLEQVHDYLKRTEVKDFVGHAGEFEIKNCWTEFESEEFAVEYLDFGSWRINAFYNKVRYYWRVDDLSLEVTRDAWVRTNNPTILC